MSVTQKYLKDENGEIFSPIVSASGVKFEDGSNLEDCGVKYKVLYSGTATIPSLDSGNFNTITVEDDISLYDFLIINRLGSSTIVPSKGVTGFYIVHSGGSRIFKRKIK